MFILPLGLNRWGKAWLKLRIYVDGNLPEGSSPPLNIEDINNNIRDSFSIIPDARFEWVYTKFTKCNKNEFNIINTDEVGIPGEMGKYEGNAACKVNYNKIVNSYSNRYSERAGRTGAHEVGHKASSHHSNCTMDPYITDLPDNCEHFCNSCKKVWNKILGGGILP